MQELLKELSSRFDHWVFTGRKDGVAGGSKTMTVREYGGDRMVCAGLAGSMVVQVNDDVFEDDAAMRDDVDDDDI